MIMPMRNLERDWFYPEIFDIPANFQAEFGGSSVFTQTLFRRGIQSIESARGFLNPLDYKPAPPSQLPGLLKAVHRIQEAFSKQETILVWGDFDVDGQTSTTLLVSALAGFGSGIQHYIPNRSRESHGLTLAVLKDKINEHSPSVLLTCDTGIDAVEAVEFAQSSGVDVLITDHHQLPQELPPAYSIVNPNMLPEDHPLFNLPGVGVAYKLIESLYANLDLDPEIFLDLVALGIVADVARQTGDTRYLLQKGLAVLRNTPRLGLLQLLDIVNLPPGDINEETIGFVIGPRLNALGRLDDANSCVDFFTTQDLSLASGLAQQLESLNSRRQTLTEEIFQDSVKLVDDYPEYIQDYPVLVLQGPPQWHPGVIGIVASRLVDRFHKPVIMLTQEGSIARGSARSIPGVPISALISESSHLLISHGGHPMAAGLSLASAAVPQFRRNLADNFNHIVGGPPKPPQIHIDADIPFQAISESFISDFQRLAPFGAGNPKLLFSTRDVHVKPQGIRAIGKDQNHKKITLTDSSSAQQDLLWWNSADLALPSDEFDVAYSLEISSYKNKNQVQATLRYFREASGKPILVKKKQKFELIDQRGGPSPLKEIKSYSTLAGSMIWAELNSPKGIHSYKRAELQKINALVIWTIPPSREIFKQVLDTTTPEKIIFFAVDPDVQTLKKFITKLHGLLKYIREHKIVSFDSQKASQSLAVTPALIDVGLQWIHLHGDYDLSSFPASCQILPGPRKNLPGFEEIDKKLKFLLREVAAYRSYFSKAKLEALL